jgi:hypothetical protein
MKFMDQNLFDVIVLTIAAQAAESPERISSSVTEAYFAYRESYEGDNLWTDQAKETIKKIIEIAKTISKSDFPYLILLTAEIRKTMDENLKPLGKLSKFFKGTAFTQSHPAPHLRKEISIKNCQTLLIMVNNKKSLLQR